MFRLNVVPAVSTSDFIFVSVMKNSLSLITCQPYPNLAVLSELHCIRPYLQSVPLPSLQPYMGCDDVIVSTICYHVYQYRMCSLRHHVVGTDSIVFT